MSEIKATIKNNEVRATIKRGSVVAKIFNLAYNATIRRSGISAIISRHSIRAIIEGGVTLQNPPQEETDPIWNEEKGNYALKTEVPTKTSQLENDSEFITAYEVPPATNFELELARKTSGNTYIEYIKDGDGKLINVDYWVDSSKAVKLFSKALIWTENKIMQVAITNEETSAIMTTTIVYSGGEIDNITKVIS
jgi:capsid portal protein